MGEAAVQVVLPAYARVHRRAAHGLHEREDDERALQGGEERAGEARGPRRAAARGLGLAGALGLEARGGGGRVQRVLGAGGYGMAQVADGGVALRTGGLGPWLLIYPRGVRRIHRAGGLGGASMLGLFDNG